MLRYIENTHAITMQQQTNERKKKPIPIYALKIINGAVLFCSNRAWIVCGASRSMESSAEQ